MAFGVAVGQNSFLRFVGVICVFLKFAYAFPDNIYIGRFIQGGKSGSGYHRT